MGFPFIIYERAYEEKNLKTFIMHPHLCESSFCDGLTYDQLWKYFQYKTEAFVVDF